MNLTIEQQNAIRASIEHPQRNILLSALAGCAKTTTLREIAAVLPPRTGESLYLAFNKRTAEEAATCLPPHFTIRTLNALGHRAWQKKTGTRLRVKQNKMYLLSRDVLARLDPPSQKAAVKLAMLAKTHGVAPPKIPTPICWEHPTATWESLNATLTEPASIRAAQALLEVSILRAWKGSLDFADQIYMPVMFGGGFPTPTLLLVDEVQDLSPLNIQTLHTLLKPPSREDKTAGRLIAVGDAHQAIYGFRGAQTDALLQVEKQFDTLVLPLTTNFRCSQAVVQKAQALVPALTSAPDAPPGKVNTLTEWTVETLLPRSTILCRNNAPLFKIGIQALVKGYPTFYLGSGMLEASLSSLFTSIGTLSTSAALALNNLHTLTLKKEDTLSPSALARFADKAECVEMLLTNSHNIRAAREKLAELCSGSSKGGITLSTGHRSKGFEWDNVFILNVDLIPSKFATSDEELQQEQNLLYVMTTRAKYNLTFITTRGLTL